MKKRAYCPSCGEQLVKKQFNGSYKFDWQRKKLIRVARAQGDDDLRFRHYCPKEKEIIFYPIWR